MEDAASGAISGYIVLPNSFQGGGQGGGALSTPAVELREEAPVGVAAVPVPVAPEVDGALTEKASASGGDEASSSKLPSRATRAQEATRRCRSRTKGTKTSKPPRRHSDSSTHLWDYFATELGRHSFPGEIFFPFTMSNNRY